MMCNRQISVLGGLAVLIGIGCSVVSARTISSQAGTSSFSFLKINTGARPVAMGGAFTGMADDEATLYYNPAGITAVTSNRYLLEYHNYFMDLQSGAAAVVHPLSEKKFLAFQLSYLNYGDFTETNTAGTVTGTFSGGDLQFAGTYAMVVKPYLSVGATMKFLYEKVQEFSATGMAFDIGAKYTSNRGRYTGGIMVQNLGVQLSGLGEKKDKLPMVLRLGGGARPQGLNMLIAGDIIVPTDNRAELAIGAEYLRLKPLYLRLGYNTFGSNYQVEGSSKNWTGISMGVGFDIKRMQISYAYSPAADLGESHRITLTGGF